MKLIFRAVGPAKEVIETIRLYLAEREDEDGDLTIREMMELEAADGHE